MKVEIKGGRGFYFLQANEKIINGLWFKTKKQAEEFINYQIRKMEIHNANLSNT